MKLPQVTLGASAIVLLAVVVLFVMRGCESSQEGKIDAEVEQRVSTAEHQRDSALALASRQGFLIDEMRRQRVADTAGLNQLRRDIQTVTATTGQIRRDLAGVTKLLPAPGSTDTAEFIGPRTATHIFKQDSVIVDLRSRRRTDSIDIDRLFAATDSLRGANRQLDSAYQGIRSAFETVSRQRYGWKDRVTASVCYEPVQFEGTNVGGGVCYTIIRPLRLLDRLPTWLGGVR